MSEADREVEKMIQRRLKTLFPEDGFLGEESGLQEQNSEGLWVVDPIDGTSCFLRGMSSWCVSIAIKPIHSPYNNITRTQKLDPSISHLTPSHSAIYSRQRSSSPHNPTPQTNLFKRR